jgi:hypothetical protein
LEEVEIDKLVAGDFAGADHRGFAEEIALKKRVAERTSFVDLGLRLDFFGEQLPVSIWRSKDQASYCTSLDMFDAS